ncbi:MAG: DUF4157 domain-containing protein [Planctomycetota bacterium]
MARTKTFVDKPLTGGASQMTGPTSTRRLLQLAPMPGTAHAPPTPKRTVAQSKSNMTAETAAAVIVPQGASIAQGTLELVGPGASIAAAAGHRVCGFIHADGTAVQFIGEGGGVFLSVAVANREFGSLMPAARRMLHAGSAAGPAPAGTGHVLHRRAESSAPVGSTNAVDAALKSSASQPLPVQNRNRLESSFGTNLSSVRVHTDSAADRAAASVQAKAFTTGQDVYFRAGQYQPESKAGNHLLVHEVAHTVQQGNGSGAISRMAETHDWQVSQPHDSHEREAERAADAATAGHRAVLSSLSGAPVTPTIARRIESSGTASAGPAAAAGPSSSAMPISAKSSKSSPAALAETRHQNAAAPLPAKTSNAGGDVAPGKPSGAAGSGKAGPEKAENQGSGKGKNPAPGKGSPDKSGPAAKGGKGAKPAADKPGVDKAEVGGGTKGKKPGAGPVHGDSGAGLAAVMSEVVSVGHEQQAHVSVGEAATQTVKAADVTPEEAAGKARGEHVEQMAAQKKGPFNRETFKKALRDKITALQADDAKGIKEGDQAGSINGAVKAGVEQEKQAAAGPIKQVAQQPPPKGEAKPGDKLPNAAPVPASPVDGAKGVPEPVPEERRSVAAESQAADQQMAAANVTPGQLRKSNEPAFNAAATAHETAKTEADGLPVKAQNAEAKVLETSRTQAAQSVQTGLTEMQGKRDEKLVGSKDQQEAGKAKYEAARKRISEQLGGIYEDTKKSVDARMATLDIDVNLTFEAGADLAKVKFYAYLTVELLRHYLSGQGIVDTFTGGNSKEQIFQKGRDRYLADMEQVIDAVADVVEKGLNEVVGIIENGRVQLEAAIKQFGPEDAAVAEEVAGGLRDQFASLEKSVEEKQTAIIDSVAKKYVEAQKDVDSAMNTLRNPVGALIDLAVGAVAGVIDTILKMKAMLMSTLAKAGEAIDLILADPIAFVGHLVAGVKQGVMGFLGNIGTYLQKGLLEWLFGALAQAGIQMPDKFDLSGLMSVALQVLGLTWTNIRKRAVDIVGENVVKTLEIGSQVFIMLATKGVTGIWDYIKEQATTILQSLKEGVQSFIMESVIMAGAKWLLGLLNPASAFVKACLAIYDIITFIINKGQQILAFVNAVVDSVLTIAKGNIAPAAKAVEAALAKSIPVAIGFLASLLGIGDLGDKIKKVIDKIQAPINKVIDWLIKKAVALVKTIGKALGLGEKAHPANENSEENFTDAQPVDMAGHSHELIVDTDGDTVTLQLASTRRRAILGLITTLKRAVHADKGLSADERDARILALEKMRVRTSEAIGRIWSTMLKQKKTDAVLQDPTKRKAIRRELLRELIRDIHKFAERYNYADLVAEPHTEKGDAPASFWDMGMTARGLLGEALRGGNRDDPFAPVMDRHEKGGIWESHKTMGGKSYTVSRILSTGRVYVEKAATFSESHKLKGERREISARRLIIILPRSLGTSLGSDTVERIVDDLTSYGRKMRPVVDVSVEWRM